MEIQCPHCKSSLNVPSTADPASTIRFSKPLSKDATQSVPSTKRIGDYEIQSVLGKGGMGVVYKARQASLGRDVALKVIASGQHASDEEVSRFKREAEAAASLSHPGIVSVFEVGEDSGTHFFSMAYVPGQSLQSLISERPLPPKEAAKLLAQVADAVQYAHTRGIIHRDLKPGNILVVSDGIPHVTDFGLAKRTEVDSSLTATGQVLGTPSYMAPEQARGEEAKEPADIYSLGAILYCLLTGRPPFQAASVPETIQQALTAEPVSIRRLNRHLSRDLDTICMKCLEKEPRRRFESAAEVAAELTRYLEGRPIHSCRITPIGRTWRWCKRRPLVAGLLSLVGILTITGSILFIAAAFNSERRASAERMRDAFFGFSHKDTGDAYAEGGNHEKALKFYRLALRYAVRENQRKRLRRLIEEQERLSQSSSR